MNTSIWPDTAAALPRRVWWRELLCKPDALSVMERQLADAQRDLAGHAALTEYHAAMRDMLRERCARLVEELHGGSTMIVQTSSGREEFGPREIYRAR